MVCIDNNFQGLKDFPKGLRVLLLDHDPGSAAELKARLEAMDYVVTIFCDENEALSAITNKLETFHVAIVGVKATSGNSDGSFKFLETARDLPTIMISDVDCLSTTMRCIALGAVEFLHKPIREDKLKNIWQHVVHKVCFHLHLFDVARMSGLCENSYSLFYFICAKHGPALSATL
ncbi:hypothetical protein SAY86_020841 [Trapa natans]|uniref:Response regulatory domain-containing protein n=1 Tax=Trapa natans TaxID=22666 RepID=A0AAN7M8R3_TRANT|nr:hypothetical protein SAY86_020841 [Trapa natans]